jgi:integrin alpha 7
VNVKVENHEDSAYESQVFVVHQPSVTYIAASKGSVICNRFNSTVVGCTLGNPMRRDSNAEVRLRFDPSGLEDSAPQLTFTIFANSTSKQLRPVKDTVLITKVVKKSELSISGWAKPEQVFYGGDIKGESAMEYVDDIGTQVQHTYQV